MEPLGDRHMKKLRTAPSRGRGGGGVMQGIWRWWREAMGREQYLESLWSLRAYKPWAL